MAAEAGIPSISFNFEIQLKPVIEGSPKVELLLAITGESAGKSVATLIVNQHRLNVDAISKLYSTDYPTGGTEIHDRDNRLRAASGNQL